IVTKSYKGESNTRYAQGGMAVVTGETDSFDSHVKDTLDSGGNLSNIDVVKLVVKKAPEQLNTLIKWGASFDKTKDGSFDLGLEGGHSSNRIVHSKDTTGYEIEKTLLTRIHQFSNIEFFHHKMVVDLILDYKRETQRCIGISVFDSGKGEIQYWYANNTVLCTGGCGQVFKTTTNPEIATGDGVAIAVRASVQVVNMQYIQFHPTGLFFQNRNPSFLISEAVRGFGVPLVDIKERRFMFDYDNRGELATRDIVSDGIFKNMYQLNTDHVYMDFRKFKRDELMKKFPTIVGVLEALGFNLQTQLVPVAPAAHYQCGGINVDINGKTSLEGLYAVGECANTGLHGRNRLASNSLIEALVFAVQTANELKLSIPKVLSESRPTESVRIPSNDPSCTSMILELRQGMTDWYQQRKDENFTRNKIDHLTFIIQSIALDFNQNIMSKNLLELRNLAYVARIILLQSLNHSSK
nr:FAD-binding protein [Chitinophagaceae bacterium]